MDQKEITSRRLLLLLGFLLLVLTIYVGVLYKVQVLEHDHYLAQSVRTIAREEPVEASRGIITDRNGQPMVSSRPSYSLSFDPSLLSDQDDENQALLRLLQLCEAQNVEWMDNLPISKQAPYVYTIDELDLGVVGRIGDMSEVEDLPGHYDLDDTVGKTGIERAFEEYLKGTDGRRIVSTNSEGKITGEFWSQEPRPGNTVELTIDLEFQAAVEQALGKTIDRINAKDHLGASGGAVVIKVGTGEILSLASYPSYDPARYFNWVHAHWEEPRQWAPDPDGEVRCRDFYGGTLRGITARLPFLSDLGVTTLYLNPIFESASNHRYNTADYHRIDPMLGTEEDFCTLCRQAHALGMRVLLDGVFNQARRHPLSLGRGSSAGLPPGDGGGVHPLRRQRRGRPAHPDPSLAGPRSPGSCDGSCLLLRGRLSVPDPSPPRRPAPWLTKTAEAHQGICGFLFFSPCDMSVSRETFLMDFWRFFVVFPPQNLATPIPPCYNEDVCEIQQLRVFPDRKQVLLCLKPSRS